jgi:pimeloyl-ACP methyl ester carboxylesterase
MNPDTIILIHGFWVTPRSWENWKAYTSVPVVPLSQLKSTFPVLRTIGRKKAAGFTFEQWHYAFTNTFTEEESRAPYERYPVPASVRVLGGSALATLESGHQDTFVNYKNDDRAPLLFISGGEDHLMPPSVQRSNARHYKSSTATEVKEYPGYAHLLPAQKGWEQIADDALAWAVEHAR